MAALAASEVALAMRLPVLPWRVMLLERDMLPLFWRDTVVLPCLEEVDDWAGAKAAPLAGLRSMVAVTPVQHELVRCYQATCWC